MLSNVVRSTLFIASLAVAALLSAPLSALADSGTWTAYNCKSTVSNYPVTGGSLNGRGCASWWTGSTLQWEIWGDTSVLQSYSVYTYVSGSDSCDNQHWTFEMSSSSTVYNTNYGTSGPSNVGPYQDCGQYGNHYYQVYGNHLRQATSSGDPWQGSSGYVSF